MDCFFTSFSIEFRNRVNWVSLHHFGRKTSLSLVHIRLFLSFPSGILTGQSGLASGTAEGTGPPVVTQGQSPLWFVIYYWVTPAFCRKSCHRYSRSRIRPGQTLQTQSINQNLYTSYYFLIFLWSGRLSISFFSSWLIWKGSSLVFFFLGYMLSLLATMNWSIFAYLSFSIIFYLFYY